jgi:hypothetical protein
LTISRQIEMMREVARHEYILHYATARPFAQYALKVTLSDKERAVIEERLDKMVEEGALHHFDLVVAAELRAVSVEEALQEVVEAS